jgi:hypothetical protein
LGNSEITRRCSQASSFSDGCGRTKMAEFQDKPPIASCHDGSAER